MIDEKTICDKCDYQHFNINITRIIGMFDCAEPNNIYGWSSGGSILFTHKEPEEMRESETECKYFKIKELSNEKSD